MADNSNRTPGSGETIASDDVGGVKYQRVKLNVGVDGAAVDVRPPTDSLPGSTALPAGLLVWDDALAAFRMVRTARSDTMDPLSVPASTAMLYNGSLFERQRGNTSGVLLAPAARTADVNTAVQTNHNARGVIIPVDVTAIGTGTITFSILNATNDGGNWVSLFSAVIPAAVTNYQFILYPGAKEYIGAPVAGAIGGSFSYPLPRNWLCLFDKSDASSWTFGAEYDYIV